MDENTWMKVADRAVFGRGDGYLGSVIQDKVIGRTIDWQSKEKVQTNKKKSGIRTMLAAVSNSRDQQATYSIFLDRQAPQDHFVEATAAQWNTTKGGTLHPVSL